MKQVLPLLLFVGIVLASAAVTILWHGPALYLDTFADPWHSAAFTRIVGVAVIVEGALLAFGAALCFGRAIRPLTVAPKQSDIRETGPVLPICGILFLLAAAGPYEQARFDSEMLEVEDSMPGQWGTDIIEADRRHERTERTFAILWLVVSGALLSTPLFLKPRICRLGWRISGVGCGIAVGGFILSGMGFLVWYANGLLLEGANKDFAFVGYIGVLVGALVALVGSIVAVLGKSKH
jgi:hypothetical protein